MFGLFGSHKKITEFILNEFANFNSGSWNIKSFEKEYKSKDRFTKHPKNKSTVPTLNSECYTWTEVQGGVIFTFRVGNSNNKIGGISCDTNDFYEREMGGKYIGLNIISWRDAGGTCLKPYEEYSRASGKQWFGRGTFEIYRILSNPENGYRVV